ncbi:MAG: hypothetical protein AAB421_05190 [Patescibacteria group bacterium]
MNLALDADQVAKFHHAAKIIQTDGSEGIRTAAGIVGPEIAMAMLVMFMRQQACPDGSFPVCPCVTEEVNRALRGEHLIAEPDTTVKPSAVWARESQLFVHDPIGWRKADVPWEKPITKKQFDRLLLESRFGPPLTASQ